MLNAFKKVHGKTFDDNEVGQYAKFYCNFLYILRLNVKHSLHRQKVNFTIWKN